MEVEYLRAILKEQLKNRGIKYEDLASQLEVSVPTVKRWLNKSDIPFVAIDKIINMIGLDWVDFAKMLEPSGIKRNKLTHAQELFLIKNPKMAYLCLLLFKDSSYIDIKKALKVDDNYLEKSFLKLDKSGLISYLSPSKVKILARGPFKHKPSGPFSKKFLLPGAKLIFDRLLSSYSKKTTAEPYQPGEDLFKFGEIFLSEKSFERLKLDLNELIEKYYEISRREFLSKKDDSYQQRVYIIGGTTLNLWKKVMWDQN